MIGIFHYVVDFMLAASAVGSAVVMYIIGKKVKVMHDRVIECHAEVVRFRMRETAIREGLKSMGIEVEIEEVSSEDHRRKMN